MRTALAVAAAAACFHVGQAAPVRITCIGDSITAGHCSTNKTHGYPAVLQQMLGSNYLVMNQGSSGHTMMNSGLCGPPANGNCSYWITPQWQAAQTSSPNIVTIFLGTNDAKQFNWYNTTVDGGQGGAAQYHDDYRRMVAIMKALPTKPKVYVVIPPPLYRPVYAMNATVLNQVLPATLPGFATAFGADGVIDVFSALGGAGLTLPQDFCDGCHPNDTGYTLVAQTFYDFLVKQGDVDPATTPAGSTRGPAAAAVVHKAPSKLRLQPEAVQRKA